MTSFYVTDMYAPCKVPQLHGLTNELEKALHGNRVRLISEHFLLSRLSRVLAHNSELVGVGVDVFVVLNDAVRTVRM